MERDSKTNIQWGPIGAFYSSTTGCWDVRDNVFINCKGNQPTTSTCSFTPPYDYDQTLHTSSEVKTIVTTWSGVGKYDAPEIVSLNNRRRLSHRETSGPSAKTAYNFRGQKISLSKEIPYNMHGIYIIKDYWGVCVYLTGVR